MVKRWLPVVDLVGFFLLSWFFLPTRFRPTGTWPYGGPVDFDHAHDWQVWCAWLGFALLFLSNLVRVGNAFDWGRKLARCWCATRELLKGNRKDG